MQVNINTAYQLVLERYQTQYLVCYFFRIMFNLMFHKILV